MRSKNLPITLFAAFVIGVVHYLIVLPASWYFISLYLPILGWLMALDFGAAVAIYTSIYVIDPVINVMLAVPAAISICLLRPIRLVSHLLLAVVPGVVWHYRLIFEDTMTIEYWAYLWGLTISLFSLPIATLFTQRIVYSRASH